MLGTQMPVYCTSCAETESQKAKETTPPVNPQHKRVISSVRISASPEIVWKAIHDERSHDPDIAYSKVLSKETENETLIEQKFQVVPILGTAVCKMKNIEIPFKRIDYWLVGSDHFKALEGSWILTPEAGNSTNLELSSFIDMGIPIPVPKIFAEKMARARIEKRLANVKRAAEKDHSHVAMDGHTARQ